MPASGGVPTAVNVLAKGENFYGRPSFLPDGRHFFYRVGNGGSTWGRSTRPNGLQAAFTTELIHRRKVYPAVFRDYLSAGLRVRQVADYGGSGISRRIAQRLVRRAESFLAKVQEVRKRATAS